MFEPSSHWNLEYAASSCRLARIFGEGDDRIVLALDRFGPGGGFQMIVAGKEVRRLTTGDSIIEVETRFGPYEEAMETDAFAGDLGEFKPALIIAGTGLGPDPEQADDEEYAWDDPANYDVDPLDEEKLIAREAKAEWISISRGRRIVYLATGPMGAPLAALRKCSDDLLGDWGVDLEEHRSLTRRAMPTSDPARWILSSDYPRGLLIQGAQGIVRFRLTVDTDGSPLQCSIQGSTRPEGFETASCDALMRRAEFAPALDAQGNPVKSYYTGSVRFQLAR
ncbi:energy transducer TonB [Alteriqipengyuania lutimaris]|nr:energy transducer TonB [Alteriqipengyuania lutimaris]MBB3034315.1 TonB family protein [Alteriqipengyuania lutimaris]